MKKQYEVYCFIALQIIITLLYIYKESRSIEVFYQNQRLEKKHEELLSQLKQLQHQLQSAQKRSTIARYAQENKLESLSLTKIRHINALEPT